MKSLVDKIFEKVNRIPTFREDPEMYRKLLEISAGYVMETIKKEGGFFPAFEEALVQREEKTRYPLQHPRFTQKVFICCSDCFVGINVKKSISTKFKKYYEC